MTSKKILILGFTKRTSFSAARILLEMGNEIAISDSQNDDEKLSLLNELQKLGPVEGYLGTQSIELLDLTQPDLILISPGVPMSIPVVREAKNRGIPVVGDIEFFYRLIPDITYVGITGTDGKTTTTTLVYEIVKQERKALIGGNVGVPIFEHYHAVDRDSILVLELSSFQLEAVRDFHPRVAAVLNIAEDHLDRYDSMGSYLSAKKNIFKNQGSNDYAVLNLDSPYFERLKAGIRSKILTFSSQSDKADCYFKDGTVYYKGGEYLKRDSIPLKGVHNIENAMAAILIAGTLSISDDAIKKTLSSFEGLEHRLEFVKEINGAEYYNDSKSTTVNSLNKALQSFERPIILIAGGRDKGLDFKPLQNLVKSKLKKLILIGEAAGKLKNELDFQPFFMANDLKDAVQNAYSSSVEGDIILLSPGCSSFDMFNNYEERGRKFKEIVNGII